MYLRSTCFTLWIVAIAAVAAVPSSAGRARRHEAPGSQLFTSPQSNPIALEPGGDLLLVASTTSNRVDAIDASTNAFIGRILVGIDPSGIAFKPDGTEAWVTNHISDTVSVIDTDSASSSYLRVVETVQDVDGNGQTSFDEPVGVAFKGDGTEAYVTLSSANDVAVVDTATYQVTGRIHIPAQDPRAVAVSGNFLYVAAFESGNTTELAACETASDDPDPNDCSLTSLDLVNFVIASPNMPGEIKNIDADPDVPDMDLFVINTNNHMIVDVVEGVGTLLYGIAVDGNDVYITQADARNDANGIDELTATPPPFLIGLENRMFFNRIAHVSCVNGNCGTPSQKELELGVGSTPSPALATPYGIAVTSDGNTIVATAAGSSRVFTYDASGSSASDVLDHLDVGAIPRGLALRDNGNGTSTAYVLNTLDNTVTPVTVTHATGALAAGTDIPVGADPTPENIRLGRIAFNDANASTSGTFSCASCHPDGHTDQLLWRIGGQCVACPTDEARSTMPIKGLRDSLPLHWDGTLGDPWGGPNGSDPGAQLAANCDPNDPQTCFRQLVNGSLSGVMCDQDPSCATGPSGLAGLLSNSERDDMADFLEVVSYGPPRSRRADDVVTSAAVRGFEDFYHDQGTQLGILDPNTCADSSAGCHELPLGTASNSASLAGFDAPTMRGMTDRFLQFSVGLTAASELMTAANGGVSIPPFGTGPPNPFPYSPADGVEENTVFGVAFTIFTPVYNVGPQDMFEMFEQASTGHSGAIARQVMLNTRTANAPVVNDTENLLALLEAADANGLVNLRGDGLRNGSPVGISYKATTGSYQVAGALLTRADMISEASSGALLAQFTAHLRSGVSESTPQPLIAPVDSACGTGNGSSGDPDIPSGSNFTLEGAHAAVGDEFFLDGQPTGIVLGVGDIASDGSHPCGSGDMLPQLITVSGLSRGPGTELLQLKSAASGLLSPEVPLP